MSRSGQHWRCWLLLSVVVVLLAGCGSGDALSTANPIPPENNVDPQAAIWRFEYAPCGPNPVYVLDAGTDTLIYTPFGTNDSITVPFTLTEAERSDIAAQLEAMNFFAYPAEFRVRLAANQQGVLIAPAADYRLMLDNSFQQHTVHWIDNMVQPNPPAAQRMRSLFTLLIQLIEQRPAVQQLPPAQGGCE